MFPWQLSASTFIEWNSHFPACPEPERQRCIPLSDQLLSEAKFKLKLSAVDVRVDEWGWHDYGYCKLEDLEDVSEMSM